MKALKALVASSETGDHTINASGIGASDGCMARFLAAKARRTKLDNLESFALTLPGVPDLRSAHSYSMNCISRGGMPWSGAKRPVNSWRQPNARSESRACRL